MALTRKFLSAMGIEAEQIDQIISAHAETVNALKDERDRFKADADKVVTLEQQIEELEKSADDGGFEQKYSEEHNAFIAFKAQVEADKANAEKAALYRKLLVDAGVDERRIDSIMRVTDLSDVTVKDGKIDDSSKISDSIKSDWADFITEERRRGADVENPHTGGDSMTKESFEAMPLSKRMEYANAHPAEAAQFMQ